MAVRTSTVFSGVAQPEKVRTFLEDPFFNSYKNELEPLVNNVSLSISIYDLEENFLLSLDDLSPFLWWVNDSTVEIDLFKSLKYNSILNGTYLIKYYLNNNLLGDINRRMNIIDISDSRKEIRIIQTDDISIEEIIHFSALPKIDQSNHALELIAKINETENRIISILTEFKADRIPQYSIILKFEVPIDANISTSDSVFITLPLTQELNKKVAIFPTNKDQFVNILKTPNFNVKINNKSNEQSAFKNWNQLISTNEAISNRILSKYFSTSSLGIPLNIDFKEFENFIFYSSAKQRLESFRYKLKKIESYEGSISQLYTSIAPVSASLTGSSIFINNVNKFKDKKLEVLKSFDTYENYLFYSTSSYESSSYGEFYSASWPKQVLSGSQYIPISVSSSIAENWYDGVYSSASIYDNINQNKLTNLIPIHVQDDELNSDYIKFVEFVAHQFDELWIYAKHHEDFLLNRDESLYTGLAKDLIYNELRSYGWDGINEHQFEDLWYYSLGTDEFGNTTVTGSSTINETLVYATSASVPTGDISKEFWKRILNNLPYIRKTQGTKEGIRALVNCYGIPPTILRIKEYGGPNLPGSTSYSQFDKFTYALDFDQSNESYVAVNKNSLESSQLSPNVIEFRFKTINASLPEYLYGVPTSLARQVLLKKADNSTIINLVHTHGVFGTLNIILSGCVTETHTLTGPFFNGEWWSFMLRHNEDNDDNLQLHTFDAYVKMAKWFNITHAYSSSFAIDGSDVSGSGFVTLELFFEDYPWYLGGGPQVGANYPFHGQMQGFKYWGKTITEGTFNNHVTAPSTINGNLYTDSYDYLGLYFPLGIDLKTYNHSVTETISSLQPDFHSTNFYSFGELTGSMINFPDENNYVPVYDYYSMTFPDISGNRLISNKIRIENSTLTGSLSPYSRTEVSSFDTYPSDNPKFGVYFSTTNEVNDDIAEQFDGLNIDDYIGGWDNFFSGSYPSLQIIKNHYFQKFHDSYGVYDYIRLTKFYNNSLFNHIKETTPARAKKLLGFVVEPHILNRTKIALVGSEPTFTSLAKSCSINEIIFSVTGSNPSKTSGSLDLNFSSISGFMGTSKITGSGMITGSLPAYSEQATYSGGTTQTVNTSNRTNGLPTSLQNLFYNGCKLTAPAINVPSTQTPDGGPIITINRSNSNTLVIKTTSEGTNLQIVSNPLTPILKETKNTENLE